MTRTELIIVVVLAVGAVAALLIALSGGGPRVTTIETRREREKDGDDA
jgi:hypothetical protein